MKEHFIKELQRLMQLLSNQGSYVEEVISRALESAAKLDEKLAAQIIAGDSVIDEEEIRIEEECLKILALYQPVATDLRIIVAALKINSALERMADFAAHIAEHVSGMHNELKAGAAERIDFSAMAQATLRMLRDSMDVMRHSDPVLAYKVIDNDDEVDKAHEQSLLLVRSALRRFPEHSGYYLDCAGISRDLERIADLASEICENIIYLETGKIIRHRNG